MQFTTRKRRQAPAVIIISLIDILIVLLIFLMVTTTFKQQPAVRLALPQSKQPRQGAADAQLIVTIARNEPYYYIEARPVTLAKLQAELNTRASKNPKLALSIRADANATFQHIIEVMDAAKSAQIKTVDAFTKPPGQK